MSLSERIGGHIRANTVGYLALFVALTGTSYAATQITSKQIAKNAITSKLIKDGQVASVDVADDGLTGTDINEATLNGIQGPPGAVGAVGPQGPAGPSGQSTGPAGGDLSGNYPNPQIAPGAITNADIAGAAAIDASKLAANVALLDDPSQIFTAPLTLAERIDFSSGALATALNASDPDIATALDIGDNAISAASTAVTAAEVARLAGESATPTRTLHLPLVSFVNQVDNALLDFTASNGTSPDLVTLGGNGDSLAIEFDGDSDGAGTDAGDADTLATSFTVPADYLSGNTYLLRVSKPTHTTGQLEFLTCTNSINNGSYTSGGVADVNTTALVTETISGGNTPAPGDTVNVRCNVREQNNPPEDFNDTVRLHSIQWRYTASQ